MLQSSAERRIQSCFVSCAKIQILLFQFGHIYENQILVDIEYDVKKFRNLTHFLGQIWQHSDGFSLAVSEKVSREANLIHTYFQMDTIYDRTKFAISSFLRLNASSLTPSKPQMPSTNRGLYR